MSEPSIDLDHLNEKQHQAVTAEPGHLLVIAGAGSGKTSVLVNRIAWLVQTQAVSPYAILAVTFTNKAAGEMRHRVETTLKRSAGSFWIGTFHSIAHRLLRSHYKEAGLPENFQILDSDDQQRLIKRGIKALGLNEEKWSARQVQWFINGKKDEGVKADQIHPGDDIFLKTMKSIYQNYEDTCQRSGLVDFAEILLRAYHLFLNNDSLRQHYQQRFKHILVDEFQDTNRIQYDWIKLLTTPDNFVMAVGDDDQSIYGWRGAQIENIFRFEKEFSNVNLIRLEQNYRSTGTILSAANSLISNNDDRYDKALWTEGQQGDPISVYAAFNDLDEAKFIANQIKQWRGTNGTYREVAILYRSNAQSRLLEEALLYQSIPYRVYGGLRYFERAEIKDALAYLRLISNRHDDAAFERVINLPTRGIGDKTLQTLRDRTHELGYSLWQAAIQAIQENCFSTRAHNALVGFMKLIDSIAEDTEGMALETQCEQVLHRSGLWQHYTQSKGEKAQAKVENLEELVNATKSFETNPDDDQTVLSQFLSHAALEAGEAQADEQGDAVQLMTLHSAKGLEFPLVFIAGVEEGIFPHSMSHDDQERLSEERRLCYVGMTRAMKHLVLTYAEVRRQYGTEKYHHASRFIKEIPDKYLHFVRTTTSKNYGTKNYGSKPYSTMRKVPSRSGLQQTEIADTGLRLGQTVRHPKFGEGVIMNFEGSGNHARLQIKFFQHGTKWLVLSHANLKMV